VNRRYSTNKSSRKPLHNQRTILSLDIFDRQLQQSGTRRNIDMQRHFKLNFFLAGLKNK
jgi:hypothetical protein